MRIFKRLIRKGWKATYQGCSCLASRPWWIGGSSHRFVIASSDGAGVRYLKGKWTFPHPGCGPLTVFPTQKRTLMFLKNENILHCQISKVEYLPAGRGVFQRGNDIPAHAQLWTKGGLSKSRPELPYETILAAAVRLLPDKKKGKGR